MVYDDRSTTQQLVDKAAGKWDEFTKPYTTWSLDDLKNWVKGNVNSGIAQAETNREKLVEGVASVWDETSDKTTEAYSDISNWVYKHFSPKELKQIVGNTKDDVSHSELVKQASKKLNSAKQNYYPDDSFFEKLNKKDLQEILSSRNIPYNKKADREQLISDVRKNLRYIYLLGEKKSSELFDTLKFENRKFFDKAGQINAEVFQDWSDDDLKQWLSYHDLLPKHHPERRPALLKAARQNIDSLKEDIESYTSYKSAHAKPFLSKATDTVSDAIGAVSDTTFHLWSGSRLEQFLLSRGVSLPEAPSRQQLADLAVKYKDQAANVWGSWNFDAWSTEDLKAWLKENKQAADGTRAELVASANKYIQNFPNDATSGTQKVLNGVSNTFASAKKHAFDTWNDLELQEYVSSFGVPDAAKLSHQDLVKSAETNYNIFMGAANKHSKEAKKHLATAYSTLQIYGSQVYTYLAIAGLKLKNWFYILFKTTSGDL